MLWRNKDVCIFLASDRSIAADHIPPADHDAHRVHTVVRSTPCWRYRTQHIKRLIYAQCALLMPLPRIQWYTTGEEGRGNRPGGLTGARDRVQLSLNHLDTAPLTLNLTLYLPAVCKYVSTCNSYFIQLIIVAKKCPNTTCTLVTRCLKMPTATLTYGNRFSKFLAHVK